MLGDHPTAAQENTYDDLMHLLSNGHLDTAYLRYKSGIFFHRIKDKLIILYDFTGKDENNIPVWSATRGKDETTWQTFLQEIENLLHRFFADMHKQVEKAISTLMNHERYKTPTIKEFRSGLKTDAISLLKKEHSDRKTYFYNILNKVKNEEYQSAIHSNKTIKQIESIRKELLSRILDKPRIQVDFNELIEEKLILLSKEDTKTDSAGNPITFAETMPISIYSDDNLDDNNRIDCIIADGTAIQTPPQWKGNYPHVKWCCRITGGYHVMSDKKHF